MGGEWGGEPGDLAGVGGVRRGLVALALLLAAAARGDLVRGSVKVDVRDANGKPATANVRVRGPNSESGEMPVARSGDIYVAGGLAGGERAITVRRPGATKRQV